MKIKYYLAAFLLSGCVNEPISTEVEVIKEVEVFRDRIVRDTAFLSVHDTTYVYIHDTTYVQVYDTTYIDKIIEVEVPVYKPTMVAVRFLSHSDEWQTLQLDSIYLDGKEKVIWSADSHPDLCIDKVQFELIDVE